jgi:V8-like Glu-specific endopeptidase
MNNELADVQQISTELNDLAVLLRGTADSNHENALSVSVLPGTSINDSLDELAVGDTSSWLTSTGNSLPIQVPVSPQSPATPVPRSGQLSNNTQSITGTSDLSVLVSSDLPAASLIPTHFDSRVANTTTDFVPFDSGAAANVAPVSAFAYPYNDVCYITDSFGGGVGAQGSGVIIGPHTVLTASHVLWNADLGTAATNVAVSPGYSSGGPSISGPYAIHYFKVADFGGKLSASESQYDYAVIDFAADLSSYGSFGIKTDYPGGTVHLTGYPASANGAQVDQVGTVSVDSLYSVLDYVSISSSPGTSGGPVWINLGTSSNPVPDVVGVASTTSWACQLNANDLQTIQNWEASDSFLWAGTVSALTIQNDHLGITRVALPFEQATAIADSINAGKQTEYQYVQGLFSQVGSTTIPAVAIEATMYGVTGSSAEITFLVTQYLPAQVALATRYGLNPTVYASEALGLPFAFGDENGDIGFAFHFGPSNPSMPNSVAGDAAFGAAASNTIFGSASTPTLVSAIQGYVSNWKTFYTGNGLPWDPQPSAAEIDLAARGAAWGDLLGIALTDPAGAVLQRQVTNFLADAAQGSAIYSASLASQPTHAPFQGEIEGATAQLVGVAVDHPLI